MHSKVLALPFLLGSALAAAELEKKEYGDYPDYGNDDYYSSLMGDLDSLCVINASDHGNILTSHQGHEHRLHGLPHRPAHWLQQVSA